MKFFSTVIAILPLVSTALAQRSFIGYPASGATVSKGSSLTVQVIRPNSIQGSREVGITIGLQSCADRPCAPPEQQLGSVLFIGTFNPQLHELPGRPYQNFTVTVPDSMAAGQAQLSVDRFHLIGAGPSPVLELNTLPVTVA